jgi:YidC/Oxa1 family membrane protein insertase
VIPLADILDVLKPIEEGAEAILTFFHDTVGFNWGTSIIALTFVVRALLVPLTFRSIKGMRAMQALQPQLKEIQEKFKNDKQRMQQEMMRFYRENKINPFASCLPLLLQIPVFFALYRLLNGGSFEADVEATPGEESWLFINSVIENPQGAEAIALMVLFAVSMALSMLANLRTSPTAGKQQYVFLGAFGLVTVFIVPTFPAGLSLYWITTNVWTILQTYVAAKLIPAPGIQTPEEAAAAKPPPPPPRKKKRRR